MNLEHSAVAMRDWKVYPCEVSGAGRAKARTVEDVMDPGRKSPAIGRRAIIFVLTLTPVLFLPPHAHAQDASKILKAMSDYLTGQKTISMTFDSDIEVITSELQ